MKQIKTIIKVRDAVWDFDNAVNAALAAGWTLVRRYISNGRTMGDNEPKAFYPVLVAEFEREYDDE
jgi:hypothetical protein